MKKEFEKKILTYALANALAHGGKARVEAVLPKLFQEGLKKEQIKDVKPMVEKIVSEVNALSIETQAERFEKLSGLVKKRKIREGLKPLPKATPGKVVMRFAPFPSGPLHLGNAKTVILNDEYCKHYDGKLFLVIDDTIGSEEKQILPESYKLIPEALDWLDVKYVKPIIYKSDRLELYYKYAEELIKKGKAYVCFCDPETLHINRKAQRECEHRAASVESNLKHWKEMLEGKYKQGRAILRIKTDMKHPNPAFRDRVLFRITDRPHPRTKKKYRVWPLLEFSWAIDDHELGITHILRGKELMMESEMEKYIWNIFGWPAPELIHLGLAQLAGVKISKSKARQEILTKKYFGWDDPRTWSLQSLKRRGIRPEAIRAFCLKLGLTETEATVPIEVLYKENKKFVEVSNRYFFIANPAKVEIKSAPRLKAKLPLHPSYKERGYRHFKTAQEFWLSADDKIVPGKPYRLMNLLNFRKNTYYEFISVPYEPSLKAKLLHWLPVDAKQTIKAEVLMPDGKLIKGIAEKALSKLKPGTEVQLERFGFARIDQNFEDKIVLWFSHR